MQTFEIFKDEYCDSNQPQKKHNSFADESTSDFIFQVLVKFLKMLESLSIRAAICCCCCRCANHRLRTCPWRTHSQWRCTTDSECNIHSRQGLWKTADMIMPNLHLSKRKIGRNECTVYLSSLPPGAK